MRYRVRMARLDTSVVVVEADDEAAAAEEAYQTALPSLCVHCSGGWGHNDKISVDEGEWQTLSEILPGLDEPDVESADDDEPASPR